jgi:hypothetical protein
VKNKAFVQRIYCGLGKVFDEKTNGCKSTNVPGDCVTIDCTKKVNNNFGLLSHYGISSFASKKFYALCTERHQDNPKGLPNDIVMFKCSDNSEFYASFSTVKCIYRCQDKGNFTNSNDPESFFECKSKYDPGILHLCPDGREFDEKAGACR